MVDIIGKTEAEAEHVLTCDGKKMRVTQRDGEPYMVTMDYWPERINVVVEQGRVIQISGIG